MHLLLAPVRPDARRLRRLVLAGVFVGASLAGAGARAQGDPPGRVGRVAEITGEVRTLGAEGTWTSVLRNQPLSTGDRITTDKAGRATLQIGSTVVRLGGDSDLVVTQLDDQHIRLRFDHGQLAVRVRAADIPGELFIDTDEGAWVPHHVGQYRFDRAASHQLLAAQAWSGDMLLEAPDSSLPVSAPQRAEVWATGAKQATHYRMVPALKDAFGDAALAQDAADDKLAAANAAAQVPPEMTGAADLARFGTWSVAPDGAHAWTPAKVAPGWAPFRQGAWSWNPPWGWTWIDDQPWAFATSHYGRWRAVHGRWSWTPGVWGAMRPVYAPAVVGWFGGPMLTVGDAPAIGWVALAPDELLFPGYAVSAAYWNAITNASVAPVGRRAVAISGRARLVPVGAVAYVNRAVPDAATVVAASALLPHVPVSTMPALRAAEQRTPAFEAHMAQATMRAPPPAPAGRGALSAGASVVQVQGQVPSPATGAAQGVAAPTVPASAVKPVARGAGLGGDIVKPTPPALAAPAAVARPTAPVAPTAPTTAMKPIAGPAPIAPPAAR